MARHDGSGREYLRYIGLGFEFAAIATIGFLAGNWYDQKYATDPWGLLVCGGAGLVAGIYVLAREGLKAMKALDASVSRDAKDDSGKRPR